MTDLDKQKQKAAEEYWLNEPADDDNRYVSRQLINAVIFGADWAIGVMGEELEEANLNYKEADVLRMDAETKCERYEKALKIIWSHLEDDRNDSSYLTPVQYEMFTVIDEALRKDG